MKAARGLTVITANALSSGQVVYFTADDRWSPRFEDAERLDDEAHAQIRLLDAAARVDEVVAAYLVEVSLGRDGIRPASLRETIRQRGPTGTTSEHRDVPA